MVEHYRLTDDLSAIMSDPALVAGAARTVRHRRSARSENWPMSCKEKPMLPPVSSPDDGENIVPVSANDVDLRRYESDCIFVGHLWKLAPRLPTVPE